MKLKRILCLILALVMLCGLVACGGGKENASPTTVATTEPKEEVIPDMYLNEPLEIENGTVSINDVLISQTYRSGPFDTAYVCGADERWVTVCWTIHYTGKESIPVRNFASISLEYGDGFKFESENETYSCRNSDGTLAFASNTGTLEPLKEDKQVRTRFVIPVSAVEGTDDLVVHVNDEKSVMRLFKPDEKQKNLLIENVKANLMDYYNMDTVKLFMDKLGDFEGKEELSQKADLLEKAFNWKEEDRAYFTEHKEEYRVLNGAEIDSIILGKCLYGTRDCEFYLLLGNKTFQMLSSYYKYDISGDYLTIISGKAENFEVREVMPDVYLLFEATSGNIRFNFHYYRNVD